MWLFKSQDQLYDSLTLISKSARKEGFIGISDRAD